MGLKTRTWLLTAGLALGSTLSGRVDAANCALRNPDRRIYAMFREATGYRSVVRRIDARMKRTIERSCDHRLALNDLGRHTLYLVLRGEVPIGFVHARTQIGESGTVELVWALDLDLRVKDLWVQRSREKHTDALKSAAFRGRLAGRGLAGLRALLGRGKESLDPSARGADGGAASLRRRVVRWGVATIAITKWCFGEKVARARLLGNVHRFFSGTARVTRVPTPTGEEAVRAVRERLGRAPDQLGLDSLVALRALSPADETLGVLVFASWDAHPEEPELWWALSPEGAVRWARVLGDARAAAGEETRRLHGKTLTDLRRADASATARCTAEMLAVLSTRGVGG